MGKNKEYTSDLNFKENVEFGRVMLKEYFKEIDKREKEKKEERQKKDKHKSNIMIVTYLLILVCIYSMYMVMRNVLVF